MKSITNYLIESTSVLQDGDKVDTFRGLGKTKLISKQPVLWVTADDLGKMYIPGKGFMGMGPLNSLREKISTLVVKSLRIPEDELYSGTLEDKSKPCYDINISIQGIFDCKSKGEAKKMERALDYSIAFDIGVPEYALDDFGESSIRMSLLNVFKSANLTDGDIICVPSPIAKDYQRIPRVAQVYHTNVYLAYEEFESFVNSL